MGKRIDLSKEQLKEMLISKSDELGRSVYRKECIKLGLPSAEVYCRVFNTKSWNTVLKECGLKVNWEKFNDEDVNNMYKKLYNELNRLPLKHEIDECSYTAHSDWIYSRGLTIESYFHNLGLINKPLSYDEKVVENIKQLKELADTLKRCPTFKEYKRYIKDGHKISVFLEATNMKWNDICRKYIPEYELNFIHGEITKEDVKISIDKMIKEFGGILFYDDYKKLEYAYSYSIFYRLYNDTYENVIKSLGYDFKDKIFYKESKEQMKKDLLNFYTENNRFPYEKEFLAENKLSSYSRYLSIFGSLKNVCEDIGLDYKLFFNKNGIRRKCFDNNGDVCNSLTEKKIADYLIKNNIKFKKEVYYKDILKNVKKDYRLDFVLYINDKEYYLEYFGLYSIKNKAEMYVRYVKRTNKKIKLWYKSGLIDSCIFLFPRHTYKIERHLDSILKDINLKQVA